MQTKVKVPNYQFIWVNQLLEEKVGFQITTDSLLCNVNGFIHGVIEYDLGYANAIREIIETHGGDFDTNEIKQLYKQYYATGYWRNTCEHNPNEYIGSFTIDTKKYDVYYFKSTSSCFSWNGKEVCIRYGNEDYEYISPGSMEAIKSVITRFPYESVYTTAYSMILNKYWSEHESMATK